ncbi:phosphopantetheine-binding protein [Ruminiclostridium josui]
MAKLLIESGLKPESMIGEGAGEYVAACISEVLSLEDVLRITASEDKDFPEILGEVTLNVPQIPFVSSMRGKWMDDSLATSTDYWLQQRNSNFSAQGLQEILSDDERIFVEIGNGKRFLAEAGTSLISVQIENKSSSEAFIECMGKVWVYGAKVDWNKFYEEEKRHRIPLPTYPFERQRYWIEPGVRTDKKREQEFPVSDKSEIDEKLLAKSSKASISVSIELDEDTLGSETHAPKINQIEEMLLFKEKLEKLCSEFEGKIKVSPLLLKSSEKLSESNLDSSEKLSKRPRPDLDVPYVEPSSEVEKIIAEHWKKVLGFEKLGIHDDFFELGGHSLIAAAVASDLSKVFNIQIPMTKLLEATTIAEVAEMVETFRWAIQGEGEAAAAEEEMEGGTI